MLAGFEQPTKGQIFIDGVDVAQTPAHKRPVNTVFQNYALFPHLDVAKNVEYGLRWRSDIDKRERREVAQGTRAGPAHASSRSVVRTSCPVDSSSASRSPGRSSSSPGAAAR